MAGIAGAMSSTAVVIQVLSVEKRLGTALGRVCFAVLLFQDLAIVPVLLAIGLRHGTSGGPAMLALAAVKAVLAVGAMVAFGRLGLRPLFRGVARTGSPELFVAACLLVVLASAVATAAAGLSMALGALIGGLLLAGTEFRRQVEVTIEPFKGLLLGVFLIAVGLGFDPLRVLAAPLATLGGAVALVVVKVALIAPAARLFGLPWPAAVQAGLLLGPGGEFGFVVAVGGRAGGAAGARRGRHRADRGGAQHGGDPAAVLGRAPPRAAAWRAHPRWTRRCCRRRRPAGAGAGDPGRVRPGRADGGRHAGGARHPVCGDRPRRRPGGAQAPRRQAGLLGQHHPAGAAAPARRRQSARALVVTMDDRARGRRGGRRRARPSGPTC